MNEMKRLVLTLLMAVATLGAWAQVPQFSSNEFVGWVYNNPSLDLNASNILANRITLYTTSTGLAQTLTSPSFDCYAGQTLDMNVTWVTDQWTASYFVMSKVELTAALIDENGQTVDSVKWFPADLSRFNHVEMSLYVKRSVRPARLRFAAWKADVNSYGAVRQIAITSALRGDVNNDGEISVADVNAVIDVIMGGPADDALMSRADVNRDGEVTVADVNQIVELILN